MSAVDVRESALPFLQSIETPQIYLIKLSGERLVAGDAPTTNFDQNLGYAFEGSSVFYRHSVDAEMIGEDGQTAIATVSAAVVVRLDAAADIELPNADVASYLGRTSIALMSTPFLREVINSTAARLGITGVSLPLAIAQLDPQKILGTSDSSHDASA